MNYISQDLKKISTKIATFILIGVIISACDTVKRVPGDKQLLVKNEILVNGRETSNEDVTNQLYQQPNSSILGYRLRLNLFNIANPNPDSSYQAKFTNNPGKYERMSKWLSAKQVDRLGESFWYKGIPNFLKSTGEAPVIIDEARARKSVLRLNYYYFNIGYFNVKSKYEIDSLASKKAAIKYTVTTGNLHVLDSIKINIKTPALDSLYKEIKATSFLKPGKQYRIQDFENEKNRITAHFRNQGVYNFQANYVTYDIDTLNVENKVNVRLNINDYSYQEKDSTITEPFKVYKISDVDIYTDYSAGNSNAKFTNITPYNNFNLYSQSKLKYKPRAITDAVFITKGSLFAEYKTVLTTRYLNNLKIFNYPTILYEVDKRDSTAQSLIAKVYLSPRKKYSFGYSLEATHSNIQEIGIGASITESIRNVFNGAETLEISARGNIGSSKDLANPESRFFNVSEYGLDLRLNIPRLWFPLNTERIIPKSMLPSTQLSAGLSTQKNIGLDKQNVVSGLAYTWLPSRNKNVRLDLFNMQYVRNLNPQNYYTVYQSSYGALNDIAKVHNLKTSHVDDDGNLKIEEGTKGFTNDVLSNLTNLTPQDQAYIDVVNIEDRRIRLTENNFILASSLSFSKTTKNYLKDNDFYLFRTKVESAGSLLTLIANASSLPKNANGNYEIFNLEYSEYIKSEFEYIKYWDLRNEKVVAIRSFFGFAIPYGNASSIPFSRSYFAGGSNDNRAWQPYQLGPGSTTAINDYNEANLKIALSAEFRFKILGSLKGALFADAGNIWNALDNVTDEKSVFNSLADLNELALGTGLGLRYDLDFFVVRFDLGFKTYNPANEIDRRWFYDYNLSQSVFNFGINYPF